MFNSYNITHEGISNTLTFNSVSGTLVKSTPASKIVRFHMSSPLASMFFDLDTPHKRQEKAYPYTLHCVQVLQVMLCGGDNYLVEYIDIKGANDEH